MFRAKVKLIYRQEISERSECQFEKVVFNASYQEFLLKSQAYNPDRRFKTFSQMKENDGRANSLHYKLGFSVLHFISLLNNKIPVLTDNMGEKISFVTPRFELIESHIEDSSQHKAAIFYETGELLLIEFLGEYLLLSGEHKAENETASTFIVQLQPNLSIVTYQGIVHPQMAWIAGQQ